MTKIRDKRRLTLIILAAVVISWESVCQAASLGDLRIVKQEAWKQCEWNTWGIPADYEDVFEDIDGAVREGGEVYMSVSDWSDKAISKGGEVPIFSSKTSDTVIGTLREQAIVSVLEEWADRFFIKSGCISGYVDSGRLFCAEQARKQADIVCPEQVITDMTAVQGYNSTGAEEVLCYLQQRCSYNIIEKIPGWYRISMDYFGEVYVKSPDVKVIRKTWLADLNYGEDTAGLYREIDLSEGDRVLLAALTWCEAGCESFKGQSAVVSTVLNRVEDSRFPNTVEEVIRQKGQFVPVETGWFDKVLEDKTKIKASCYEAVDYVCQGNRTVDTLYFNQAGEGKQIGSHWFY